MFVIEIFVDDRMERHTALTDRVWVFFFGSNCFVYFATHHVSSFSSDMQFRFHAFVLVVSLLSLEKQVLFIVFPSEVTRFSLYFHFLHFSY